MFVNRWNSSQASEPPGLRPAEVWHCHSQWQLALALLEPSNAAMSRAVKGVFLGFAQQ